MSADKMLTEWAKGVFKSHPDLWKATVIVLGMCAKRGIPISNNRSEPFNIEDVTQIGAYTSAMARARFDKQDVLDWAEEAIARFKWFPSANDLVDAFKEVRAKYHDGTIRDPVYLFNPETKTLAVGSKREAEKSGHRYWEREHDAQVENGLREPMKAFSGGRAALLERLDELAEKNAVKVLEARNPAYNAAKMAEVQAELEAKRNATRAGNIG